MKVFIMRKSQSGMEGIGRLQVHFNDIIKQNLRKTEIGIGGKQRASVWR